MGFRKDAYATIWDIQPVRNTITRARISISRKNKQTGEYEQDFGGYVSFIGATAAGDATSLKVKDRIKLGDVDVNNHYDKEKKTTYTNFNIYSFEKVNSGSGSHANDEQSPGSDDFMNVEEGENEDLPF